MRLHIVGLPHTQTVLEGFTVCAFTSKIVKFGEMMTPLGYDIVLYSGEHNDTVCAEHVPVFTDAQQRGWFGEHDPNLLPTVATWNPADRHWREMNGRVVAELSSRLEPRDLLLLIGGWAVKPIADYFSGALVAEWAVGYEGWFAPRVCFESHAWRHYCYGQRRMDARWFDTVIPNFFRPDDFALGKPDDYLLFVGRVTRSKGPHIAADIAQRTGRRLIVAGSGVTDHGPGWVEADGGALRFEAPGLEYVGPVGVADRNRLMADAHALLAPTTYIEPFGAVAVEAQLCGTPVITTDWGAFPETVEHGVTGYRFRTLAEGVQAVIDAPDLDPHRIRQRALARFSLDAVAPLYDRWFQEIATLWDDGWYTPRQPADHGRPLGESAGVEGEFGAVDRDIPLTPILNGGS